MSNNNIAIVFWEDYLSIAPTIISLARGFADRGNYVDIYTTSLNPRYPPISFRDSKINVITLFDTVINSEQTKLYRLLNKIFSTVKIPNVVYDLLKKGYKFLEETHCYSIRKNFQERYLKNINIENYQYCIVTDATGLALINDIDKFPKDFLIYLSLEIEYEKRLSSFLNPYKSFCLRHQKEHLKKITNIIIQDNPRKEELLLENNLNILEHVLHLMPNTVYPAESLIRTETLQRKFEIHNKLILHIGQISDVALCLEIAQSLNNQERFSLVFHDKKFTDYNDPYLKQIRDSTNYGIYFSLKPVELDELDMIMLSADIGILAYSMEYGKNFELITNASGKLVMFLRLGIPIIAMDFFGIRELVEKYDCGIVVDKWEDVIPAADTIMHNHSTYSANSLKCFQEEFNFEAYFSKFYNSISIIKNYDSN